MFNYLHEKKPLDCTCCKLDGMVDIMSKRCVVCDLKRPNFSYPKKHQDYIANILKIVLWLMLKIRSVSYVS